MMRPNFMDEIDCGNFFDQIDDLIEFPPEKECGGGNLVSSGDCGNFPSMWNVTLADSNPLFFGNHEELSAELSVPDIVQLEWLSTFVEDSFSGAGMSLGKENLSANPNQFQTPSPVSVLESSSSSSTTSSGKTKPLGPTHHGPQRARSKRPRPTTFNPRAAIQLITNPSSSFIKTPQPFSVSKFSSESANAESPPKKKFLKLNEPEPKKKKLKITPANIDETNQTPQGQAVRKCFYCEITKTPQWAQKRYVMLVAFVTSPVDFLPNTVLLQSDLCSVTTFKLTQESRRDEKQGGARIYGEGCEPPAYSNWFSVGGLGVVLGLMLVPGLFVHWFIVQ